MTDETSDALQDEALPYRTQDMAPAEFTDPVLEVFKQDIDFTLVERNLQLTTEERARQLVNATSFIRRFRGAVTDGNQ
jgi:hypothetical protein